MDQSAESAQTALTMMRKWDWFWYDPDFVAHFKTIMISEAVNRLAMEGRPRPHMTVLALLARGDLVATGDFRWSKYEHGHHFSLEGTNKPITKRYWESLSELILDESKALADNEWPFTTVNLKNLNMSDVEIYDWKYNDNRFSIALCPPDTSEYDPTYYEEAFSAWDLDVKPHVYDELGDSDDAISAGNVQIAIDPPSKRGRRPEYDWESASASIWGQIFRAELIPQNQAQIERAFQRLLAKGDKEPSESSVRPFANRIWQEFAK